MVIDVHAHYMPSQWLDELRLRGAQYGCSVTEDASGRAAAPYGRSESLTHFAFVVGSSPAL